MKADILVFSLMTPCSMVGVCGHSGGVCFQQLLSRRRMQFVPLERRYLHANIPTGNTYG